jgi:hypothetical protein
MAECLKVDGFHPMFENTGSPAFFIVENFSDFLLIPSTAVKIEKMPVFNNSLQKEKHKKFELRHNVVIDRMQIGTTTGSIQTAVVIFHV